MQTMNRSSNIFRPIRNNSISSNENSLPDDNDNYIHIPILCCSGCTSGDHANNDSDDRLDIGDDMLPSRTRNSGARSNTTEPNRPPIIKPRYFFGRARRNGDEEENEDPSNNNRAENEDIGAEEENEDMDMDIQEQRYTPEPPSDEMALESRTAVTDLQVDGVGDRTRDVTTPPPPTEPSSSIQDDVEYVSKKKFDVNDFLSFIPLPRNHRRMRSFTQAEKRRRTQSLRNSATDGNNAVSEVSKRRSPVSKAA